MSETTGTTPGPADLSARMEILLATEECRQLMVEYALRFDHGDGVGVADLFTPDGAWRSPRIDAVGQEQLRAFFAQRDALHRRRTRHVVTNVLVKLVGPDRARGRSIAVEIRDDAGPDGLGVDTRPAIVGDYHDEFVRIDGRWLFAERVVEVAFKRETETLMEQEPPR